MKDLLDCSKAISLVYNSKEDYDLLSARDLMSILQVY